MSFILNLKKFWLLISDQQPFIIYKNLIRQSLSNNSFLSTTFTWSPSFKLLLTTS